MTSFLAPLPDAARAWVFPLDRPAPDVIGAVRAWLPTWTSHGRPVAAAAELIDGRVLVVGAAISPEEFNAGVSGCGVDAMQRAVTQAVEAAGAALVPALHVAWRDASGAWRSSPRSDFRRLAREGAVGPETEVVDATLASVSAARRDGVVRPAAEAWTGRAFGLGVAPA